VGGARRRTGLEQFLPKAIGSDHLAATPTTRVEDHLAAAVVERDRLGVGFEGQNSLDIRLI
jgi:hypothetical protein